MGAEVLYILLVWFRHCPSPKRRPRHHAEVASQVRTHAYATSKPNGHGQTLIFMV